MDKKKKEEKNNKNNANSQKAESLPKETVHYIIITLCINSWRIFRC